MLTQLRNKSIYMFTLIYYQIYSLQLAETMSKARRPIIVTTHKTFRTQSTRPIFDHVHTYN